MPGDIRCKYKLLGAPPQRLPETHDKTLIVTNTSCNGARELTWKDKFYARSYVKLYVQHPSSEGDNVFSSARLCFCLIVCLSVNTVTPEPLEIS